MRAIWMVLFSAFCFGMASGQRYSFVEYSISDGLSSPNVTCFAQDHHGFTWIGTGNGLNRFDGTHVQVYAAEDGLPNSHITNLCQVGDAIIGSTVDGHLFKVKGDEFEQLEADASEISEVFELNYYRDTLWIAAMKSVYTWVNGSLERLPYFQNQDSIAVSGIEFDNTGTLYAGTHHYGILKRISNANFKRIPMPDIRGVHDFSVLPNGELYMGGHHFLLNPKDSIVNQYRPSNQRDRNWSKVFCQDGKGGIWIGSDETGLYHYLPKSDKLIHFGEDQGLTVRSITALFLDGEGVLWIGARGKGFVRLFSDKLQLHTVFNDDNAIGIHKLDNSQIWASTLTSELFRNSDTLRMGNYEFRSFDIDAGYDYFRNLPYQTHFRNGSGFIDQKELIPKPDYTVWCMEQVPSGIWMGMNYALFKREPHKTSFYNRDSTGFPSDVIYSLDYEEDSLWVGMEVGAACLVNNRLVWRHKSPDSVKNSTKIIFRDSKGRVWLGGNKRGLYQKQKNEAHAAIPNSQWRNVQITDIIEDEQGRVWVSSNKSRIAILQGSKWSYIGENQGLPSGKVMSMALHASTLVVGTDHGIYSTQIDGDNPATYHFQQADQSGVFNFPCNRNAAQADDKGRFWIGTTSGVLQYEPGTKLAINSLPRPYLRSAQLLYASTPLDSFTRRGEKRIIPYADNSLRFKVGSIYYLSQEHIEYSYLLEGSSANWSSANKSTDITIDNLSPGTYTLKLRGRDGTGDWSSPSNLLEFTIERPFWLSTWFYGLVTILLISAVIGAVRFRTRQLQKRNKELEDYAAARTREVKEQNKELEEQYREKEVLLQEIHHRVKNNLQIITSLLTLQLRRVSDTGSQEVLNQSIGRINTMSLIHQSLYQTRNLATTNFRSYLKGLIAHIMSNFEDVSEIEYSLSGDDIELGTEVAIPAALIAHEWINNIYKHAFPNKKGFVEITLKANGNAMRMEIADNGVGISKAEFLASKGSLGAEIIDTLSQQLDADLEINRRQKGGTSLVLTLDITQEE